MLPFGEQVASTTESTQKKCSSGQYQDEESGFNYNYFRDYDPSLGGGIYRVIRLGWLVG